MALFTFKWVSYKLSTELIVCNFALDSVAKCLRAVLPQVPFEVDVNGVETWEDDPSNVKVIYGGMKSEPWVFFDFTHRFCEFCIMRNLQTAKYVWFASEKASDCWSFTDEGEIYFDFGFVCTNAYDIDEEHLC